MRKFFDAAVVCAALCVGSLSLAATSASAELLDTRVAGNEVAATIALPGDLTADLAVRFENAAGLTLESLGLTAQTVDPLDPALLNRLQAAGLVSLAGGFPVMVTVDPPADGGLSFSGLAEVELYTKNLHYAAGSPLRLFSAEKGGNFRDVTDMIAGGSYRTRGSKGNFSDFLIVADARPLQQVISLKFDRLDTTLINEASVIGPGLSTTLANHLAAARNAWQSGRFDDAIAAIEDFDRSVGEAGAAGQVPNEWRAAGGVRNLAGELRADARTLRFSLTLAANNL